MSTRMTFLAVVVSAASVFGCAGSRGYTLRASRTRSNPTIITAPAMPTAPRSQIAPEVAPPTQPGPSHAPGAPTPAPTPEPTQARAPRPMPVQQPVPVPTTAASADIEDLDELFPPMPPSDLDRGFEFDFEHEAARPSPMPNTIRSNPTSRTTERPRRAEPKSAAEELGDGPIAKTCPRPAPQRRIAAATGTGSLVMRETLAAADIAELCALLPGHSARVR
ncbi:MAG: hypothetical protein KF774_10215 [Planctomyces sp.]|nr:hypothetical protein [Planctomyces sp.]